MKKIAITASVIGVLLIIAGLSMIAVALKTENWDIRSLDTVRYQTKTHSVDGEFYDISVYTDTADVKLVFSDGGECKVVCEEREKLNHSVEIEDGALVIRLNDERKWYEHITFFSFGNESVTVYLPKNEYGKLIIRNDTGATYVPEEFSFENIDISQSTGGVNLLACARDSVKIKTSTGAIHVDGISAASLELSVSTGDINVSSVSCFGDIFLRVSTGKADLKYVTCDSLLSEGGTGDITLCGVVAANSFDIERGTGNVRFEACDAATVKVETGTGDVSGTFLTDKIFAASSDTGRVKVPKSTTGGLCEIETDTGDIKIEIVK